MATRFTFIALSLSLGLSTGAAAQSGKAKSPPDVPTISSRSYVGGTAKLVVTGAVTVSADVALNLKASYSDGEKTWLQFGTSGVKEPNVLITYGDGEMGIILGSGSSIATAESQHCSGRADVTAAAITGQYSCKGVTAFDKSTMKMNPIQLTVTFTAKS